MATSERIYRITLPSLFDEFRALAEGARFFEMGTEMRNNECIMVSTDELAAVETRLKDRYRRQIEALANAVNA